MNIVLIGFMGTGKSSIGIRLAQKLHRDFIDMDKEIEKVNNLSVSEIFRRYGEVRFRSEEKVMAVKLAKKDNLVIATGGGVVLEPDNIKILKENGFMICLQARPEDIFARVNRKKTIRPLLQKISNPEQIAKMLEDRKEYYKCADINIDTSEKNIDMIVNEILNWFKTNNKVFS